MTEEVSLEGWAPEPTDAADLARIVDLAFDYRGDVTLVMNNGTERIGYVFNRVRRATDPYLELMDPTGTDPLRVRYADLRTIHFTGKDTASGKSYAAWLTRKDRG